MHPSHLRDRRPRPLHTGGLRRWGPTRLRARWWRRALGARAGCGERGGWPPPLSLPHMTQRLTNRHALSLPRHADRAQEVVCLDEWSELPLRCCLTLQPLTDPARGSGCAHLSRCNFGALRAHAARQKTCPWVGCDARLLRTHDVVRDAALAARLRELPQNTACVWVRGEEVCTRPPAAAAPLLTAAPAAARLEVALQAPPRRRSCRAIVIQ